MHLAVGVRILDVWKYLGYLNGSVARDSLKKQLNTEAFDTPGGITSDITLR